MINLRYHIVSIVAVFLALGIGVGLGATFIDRATVDFLNNRLNTVENEVKQTNDRNRTLRQQLDQSTAGINEFSEQSLDRLYDDRLTDVPVVILAAKGIDPNSVDDLRRAVVEAGSQMQGMIWFNEKLALSNEDDIEVLASILGVTGLSEATTRRGLRDRLAAALIPEALPIVDEEGLVVDPTADTTAAPTSTTLPAQDPEAVEEGPPAPPLLVQLRAAGFIDFVPPANQEVDLTSIPAPGTRYLIVGGSGGTHATPIFTGLLEQFAGAAEPVRAVAVETISRATQAEPERQFVGLIRASEPLALMFSTVDNLEDDQIFGVAASIFALVDSAEGRIGHYGTGPAAQRMLPAAPS